VTDKQQAGVGRDEEIADKYAQEFVSTTGVKIKLLFREDAVAAIAEARRQDAERIGELEREAEKWKARRKSTADWYARHYGKLEDWARKALPEPWVNQFFSCVANGLYDATKDVAPKYRAVGGFDVVPGNYFDMSDAKGQLIHDQTERAEAAEAERDALAVTLGRVRETLAEASKIDLAEWGGPYDSDHPQGLYTCGWCSASWKPNGPGKEFHAETCVMSKIASALASLPPVATGPAETK